MAEITLLAAFIAGMVALFAPCCLSYLFPAYLGNILRERTQVLFMTIIYSMGIFTVMLPIVLGANIISSFFVQWHDQTYIFGGVLLILVAILTFVGIKLPMPHFAAKSSNKVDIPSTFSLGLISGITSACCAPVLLGVLTLSTFSPSILMSLAVGFSYVLGMVTPLYIASFFIKKQNILQQPILKKKIFELDLAGKRPIFVANIVGAAVFFIFGSLMIVLAALGKISMPTGDDSLTKLINQVALTVTDLTKGIPLINLIFLIAMGLLLYWMVIKVKDDL